MAILYTICAVVGSSTSLSVSMITKNVFGEQGAKVFSIVICMLYPAELLTHAAV